MFTEGEARVDAGVLVVKFPPGRAIHKVKISCEPFHGNCVSVRLRVTGFSTLRFALGVSADGQFRRLSVQNLWLDRWVDLSLAFGDLAFRIQNAWATVPDGSLSDLHLHLTGEAGEAGSIEIERIELCDEQPADFRLCVPEGTTTFQGLLDAGALWTKFEPMSDALLEVLGDYLHLQTPESEQQAEAFMLHGHAPSYRVVLDWCFDQPLPTAHAELNTYRWAWHGLYPVTVLANHARKSGRLAPLFAARDLVNAWLDRSYYAPDPDQKYAWYDHGVGDRLVAFTVIWDYGLRLGFDQRFMARVLAAIASHMKLLGSETFYACHQRTRHHNHAVFQDIWLMFATLAIPSLAGSRRYFELAAARATDQLEQLLARDGEYAVLVENSVSYHLGFQWMVELVDKLVRLGRLPSPVRELATGMTRFTELARYPDGRLPGIGDSPRRANGATADAKGRTAYTRPSVHVLARVGHVFVKGNHDGRPFMLTMSATSLGETHKHEDNLSFTLYLDGVEWLIDPSFHSYEPTLQLPRYLRSAAAHNTLVLPDQLYSLAPGVARINAEQRGDGVIINGEHTAYHGFRIARRVEGRLDALALAFKDEVVSTGGTMPERAYLMLHCGDGVEVESDGARLLLSHPTSELRVAVELPSERCRTFRDTTDRGEPRGVTGLGFTERGPITSVECELTNPSHAAWQIRAVR